MDLFMDSAALAGVIASPVEPWWFEYAWMAFAVVIAPPLAKWWAKQNANTKRAARVATAAFNHVEKLASSEPSIEPAVKAQVHSARAAELWEDETGAPPPAAMINQIRGVAESLVKDQNLAKLSGKILKNLQP